MTRRRLLMISIAVSAAFHGALIAVAPQITVVHPIREADAALRPFRLRIIDVPPPPPRATAPDGEPGLATRPGTVRDLLQREIDRIDPGADELREPAEIPRLAERIASDIPARLSDLTPPDTSFHEGLDARIIEISQDQIREEVQVARRLVRPSPTRLLDEGSTPTLRSALDIERESLLLIEAMEAMETAGAGGGGDGEDGQAGEEPPPRELDPLTPPDPQTGISLRPVEREVARAPVIREIEQETSDYATMDNVVELELETYEPPDEPLGYFRLRIAPRKDQQMAVLPKDVTFVVDASNSIVQRKLDLTVRTLTDLVQRLRPEDRFNIVVFRDAASGFRDNLTPAVPEEKQAALSFLNGLQSRGETDVYQGIRPVIDTSSREGVPSVVMLLSDGRPTRGIMDGRTIINALTDENAMRNTIFAFGGGRTVNRYLLDLLAYRNKGESHIADGIEQIPGELQRFFGRLEDPLLVDCRADFGRIEEELVFPRDLPDFYRGQAVTVYGRFDPRRDGEFAMRLTGKAGPERRDVIFATDLADAKRGTEEIARNWAFRKIYHLIGEICRLGERPELLAELRQLSAKYNIRTSYD